jgi:hypothetical protein
MASTLEAFLLRFGLASAAEKLKLLGARALARRFMLV